MTQPRWREWPPDIQSVLFLTVPVIPEWSFCFPTATTRFIWSVRTRRGTARYQLNSELSIESYKVTNWGCEIIKANYVRKYGKVVHVYFNFTVKADHVAPYISLFALPCKPISMMEVLPPFFRRIDGTQIPTRYLSDYGVIQSTYTLDVSSDYVFEWVFICE